jgi:hypothetical protein
MADVAHASTNSGDAFLMLGDAFLIHVEPVALTRGRVPHP